MIKTTALMTSAAMAATLWSTAPLAASRDAVLANYAAMGLVTVRAASDGANRMRLADRVPMLTQRVAAASCALTSGVAVEASHDRLAEAMFEMDIILDALRAGDEEVGVYGPETDRRLVHDVEALAAEWTDIHGAVEAVLVDAADTGSAHAIDDRSRRMLKLGKVLSADFVGAYSDPFEMTKADALLLKIASRQKTFTQKMALAACEVWSGHNAEAGRADLAETMGYFDASLRALQAGAPELGLAAAPTPAIEKKLGKMIARWEGVRANLDALLAGEALDRDARAFVFEELDVELKAFDELLSLYHDHAGRMR